MTHFAQRPRPGARRPVAGDDERDGSSTVTTNAPTGRAIHRMTPGAHATRDGYDEGRRFAEICMASAEATVAASPLVIDAARWLHGRTVTTERPAVASAWPQTVRRLAARLRMATSPWQRPDEGAR